MRQIGAVIVSKMNHINNTNSDDALREYEALFHSSFDAFFTMAVEKDGSFRFLKNNKHHQNLTGFSLQDLKGKTPYELFAKEAADHITTNCNRCYEHEKL